MACPVYGHEAFVKECLDAVVDQTVDPSLIQLIIIEDHSPDASAQMVEEWVAQAKLPNITYIRHQQNRGLYYGLQEAFELAQGEYFAISSGDDRMLPNFLQQLGNAMDQAPDRVACAFADHNYIDMDGHITGETMIGHKYASKADVPQGKILGRAIWDAPFVTQAAMFRVSAMRSIGHRYRPEIICEDWDLILQLAAHKFEFVFVDAVVASYRTDPRMSSMLRSYDQRLKRNRMYASVMRMMLDVLKVGVDSPEIRSEVIKKCIDLSKKALNNPGYAVVMADQLAELALYGSSVRISWHRFLWLIQANRPISWVALLVDKMVEFWCKGVRLVIRAKEKSVLTLRQLSISNKRV